MQKNPELPVGHDSVVQNPHELQPKFRLMESGFVETSLFF